MELLAKLGVDWKLLIAQIVNFAILLSVLTFFVYKPLLNLIDARRERIRKATEEAKRIEEQAKEMEEIRTEQLKKIDQEIGVMLEHARRQAEKAKEEILVGAKKEADAMRSRGRKQLDDERAQVFTEVQGTLARMVVRMTEKILEREFSPTDQKRLLAGLERDIPSLLR